MQRDGASFYAIAFAAGAIGTLIGTFLGWSETGVFVAGMGPVALVMLVFMLRERRDESVGQGARRPTGRRA